MSEEDARSQVGILLIMLNLAAAAMAGPSAEMNTDERRLIEGPLARMLSRNAILAGAVSLYSDPVAVIAGLGLWLLRVVSARRDAGKPQPAGPSIVAGPAPAQRPAAPVPPMVPPQPAPQPEHAAATADIIAAYQEERQQRITPDYDPRSLPPAIPGSPFYSPNNAPSEAIEHGILIQ